MMHSAPLFVFSLLLGGISAQTSFDVESVIDVMTSGSSSAWETGTAAEALLEYDNADNSVFGTNAFATAPASITSLAYASSRILQDSDTLAADSLSNCDPASLGVAALMLGVSDDTFQAAAERQLNTLLYDNLRTSSGAISHRKASAETWSDSVYMFPPFLAYYAGITNNVTLLDFTVAQLGLYRESLITDDGLWNHIAGGSHPSAIKWSTGDGWAAMGMLRVLGAIINGPFDASDKTTYSAKVTPWIKEITDGVAVLDSSDLLHNVLDDSSTLAETSGTSMLAASVYRLAVLSPDSVTAAQITWANDRYDAVSQSVGSGGIISPAVDPYSPTSNDAYTDGSPEGQAFAVMMYSAQRDCVAAGVC